MNPQMPGGVRRGCWRLDWAWHCQFMFSAADEQTFTSPQEAVNTLVAAATNDDTNKLNSMFGADGQTLVSPDVVLATEGVRMFVQRLAEMTQWITNSDSSLARWKSARTAGRFPFHW